MVSKQTIKNDNTLHRNVVADILEKAGHVAVVTKTDTNKLLVELQVGNTFIIEIGHISEWTKKFQE